MMSEVLQTYWGWPARIQIYFGIAFFLLATGLLFVLIIMVSQFFKKIKNRILVTYKSQIQNELNVLVSHAITSHIPDASHQYKLEKLRRLIRKSPSVRAILMKEIVSLKKNLLGDGAEYLVRIYIDLGLKEISLRKLNSTRWKENAQGLRELEGMEQHDCHYLFIGFLQHRNATLRKEARMGLVTLADNPLFFLDSLKDQLTEWEMIFIYKKLRRRESAQIPNFSRWFTHANGSVVRLAVRMTALFGQFQNMELLQKRLSTADEALKKFIIDTFTKAEAYAAQGTVLEVLKAAQSKELKVACLRFCRDVGDSDSVPVVEQILQDTDPHVRFEAVGSLLKLQPAYAFQSEETVSMSHHFQSPLLA